MIGVSACLIGVNCKYNGQNNLKKEVLTYLNEKIIVPLCPEQLGGLSTPRLPAEIQGGDGYDVLNSHAKVVQKDRVDVTEKFIKGAYETLKILEIMGITHVIFKGKSPSCGSGQIYDGTFTGTLKKGDGVTSALLKMKGIKVYTEEKFLD